MIAPHIVWRLIFVVLPILWFVIAYKLHQMFS